MQYESKQNGNRQPSNAPDVRQFMVERSLFVPKESFSSFYKNNYSVQICSMTSNRN